MKTAHNVHIALGSNLGDRLAFLQQAVNQIGALPDTHVTALSGVYESPAMVLSGSDPQPDYFNAVIRCRTSLSPHALLEQAMAIEVACGRVRSPDVRWSARTLDVDLVVWEDLEIDTDRLTLPHPRLAERLFVLRPLAEIDPELVIPPPFHCTVRYLLSTCPDTTQVVRTPFVLKPPFGP